MCCAVTCGRSVSNVALVVVHEVPFTAYDTAYPGMYRLSHTLIENIARLVYVPGTKYRIPNTEYCASHTTHAIHTLPDTDYHITNATYRTVPHATSHIPCTEYRIRQYPTPFFYRITTHIHLVRRTEYGIPKIPPNPIYRPLPPWDTAGVV